MQRTTIETSGAPAPIGPYSQAVKCGDMLFISGQIALDPSTGLLLTVDTATETHRVMQNLRAVLREAGMDFRNVVKTTIFLSDMSLFGEVNAVYASYLSGDFPARETVAVSGLPKGANVEISMVACA